MLQRTVSIAAICSIALAGIRCADRTDRQRPQDPGEQTGAGAQVPMEDADLLPLPPERPIGSYGFSRYVYREVDGEIVPLLIEGPLKDQVRCQDEALPCSFLELKKLYQSGADIPEQLRIDRRTLGELVGQLDALSATLDRYPTIHEACAGGYSVVGSTQNPNMGIHMAKGEMHDESAGTHMEKADAAYRLDPANPDVLLFATDGGERYNRDELGECAGDRWTGDGDYRIVGAVFLAPPSDVHPEGFAGPYDNWHLHFNRCVGARHENEFTQQGSREACEADGGKFKTDHPSWMLHAYAAPDFDNPGGVFAMWNPTIWPLAAKAEVARGVFAEVDAGDGVYASISNFSYGEVVARPGEKISFVNWDDVPHTVTAGGRGSPPVQFDSGALGTGEVFEIAFDEPGEYRIHCTLHPQMAGKVVVE